MGDGALADTFVVAIFVVVAGGTLLSGRFGILYATQIQLGLVYFGLFAATALLLYLQGSAIGAMPLKGIVALLLIALCALWCIFRRRARYLDTSVRPGPSRRCSRTRALRRAAAHSTAEDLSIHWSAFWQ